MQIALTLGAVSSTQRAMSLASSFVIAACMAAAWAPGAAARLPASTASTSTRLRSLRWNSSSGDSSCVATSCDFKSLGTGPDWRGKATAAASGEPGMRGKGGNAGLHEGEGSKDDEGDAKDGGGDPADRKLRRPAADQSGVSGKLLWEGTPSDDWSSVFDNLNYEGAEAGSPGHGSVEAATDERGARMWRVSKTAGDKRAEIRGAAGWRQRQGETYYVGWRWRVEAEEPQRAALDEGVTVFQWKAYEEDIDGGGRSEQVEQNYPLAMECDTRLPHCLFARERASRLPQSLCA